MSTSMMRNYLWFLLFLISLNLFSQKQNLRDEIINHGKIIRNAFAEEDIETLKLTHHPNVIKALAYNNIQKGRKEVLKGLRETLKSYKLEFVKNNVENIFIRDNFALEQTVFTIKGTAKKGNDTFTFSGRTMVTYIKSVESPSGWVTIREIIQPEPKS